MKRREQREMKREAARLRQEARDKRSDAEQFKLLVKRGHGHCKEAARLWAKSGLPVSEFPGGGDSE